MNDVFVCIIMVAVAIILVGWMLAMRASLEREHRAQLEEDKRLAKMAGLEKEWDRIERDINPKHNDEQEERT